MSSMAAAARTITVRLPDPVYEQVEQRAVEAHRSVEAEIVETVAAAVAPEELSPDLLDAIEGLTVLDDKALWRAARLRVPEDVSVRVEELNWKRQSMGLEAQENEELRRLLHLLERTMLVRAQAAKLLHQRGHEVPPPLPGE
jgi:plasmid stability protein